MDLSQGTHVDQAKKSQHRKKSQPDDDVVLVQLAIPKTEPLKEHGCPSSSMYVVEDGEVIKKCRPFSVAHRQILKQHPNAITLDVTVRRPTDTKRQDRRRHRRLLREVREGKYDFALDNEALLSVSIFDTKTTNPRAVPLEIEVGSIGTQIEMAGPPELLSVEGPQGTVRGPGLKLGEERAATIDECAFITVSIAGFAEKSFDIRKRLPKPIAEWLRQQAKALHDQLNQAADEIEAIPDDRNLQLVKRFLAEDPAVKFSDRHGLVDSTKPLPEPRWEPGTPIYRKIMGDHVADELEGK